MNKRLLPIGIQTFRKIREDNCYYVDKTAYIRRLLDEGTHYFLSRPRRFGKSLFLDTCKELFAGSEKLFAGLYIHDRWDWSVHHPVLRLSFGSGNLSEPGVLHKEVMAQLDALEEETGVKSRYDTASVRFRHLIQRLHQQSGQRVAVLIDEYDKPILDALDTPEAARANRDFLRGLYAVIKDSDAHVRFTFLTGVSKFSKVSLFSGLNNLKDITLDPRYSAICGYTEADLDSVFAPELPGLDRDQIRDWYNGYSWRGDEKVYNPFDLLLLFDSREFKAHWFETGSPSFLIETLFERRLSSLALEEMIGTDDLLSRFDVGDIGTEALLFQTGYLTIAEERKLGGKTLYRLGYPNHEVKQSLNEHLLRAMGPDPSRQGLHDIQLYELLAAPTTSPSWRRYFGPSSPAFPYEWHINNDIANYEGYYASVFYSWFRRFGTRHSGSKTAAATAGLDMAVLFNDTVYLFEFKVVELASAGAALAQLQERRYADKYRALGQPIYLIGVEFSRETRNLAAFEVERA